MTKRPYLLRLCILSTFIWVNTQAQLDKTQNIDTSTDYGKLIFFDDFERNESQELKDEVGNNWTTSSDKTAKGHKEVDLKDGLMHIYIHKEANHAVSVRQKMNFKDGTIEMDFKLNHLEDILVLNIADPTCKSVHAGHLINVKIKTGSVELQDLKTGVFLLEHVKARKEKNLTKEQKLLIKSKSKKISNTIELGKWMHVVAQIQEEKLTVIINGKEIGSFVSNGIGHHAKSLLRILVPRKVTVDNLKIWRKK
ncbi:hypothetical protein HW347_04615 [Zobellia sp. KMM 6746]|uniref:3-keto-disaccharide hydrolase domain-containing protein n=1 Tax=Zobellia barbeyronii TaxID=2748009 RepID=A0ABS5WAW2_9FLAO|nr:hypothetical protein [Zobellia barbeyronii]